MNAEICLWIKGLREAWAFFPLVLGGISSKQLEVKSGKKHARVWGVMAPAATGSALEILMTRRRDMNDPRLCYDIV
jgi:hypothetical protein